MISQFDFYEAADGIGSKKFIREFVESLRDEDAAETAIVKKSARIWAIFSGEGTFLIPDSEPVYTTREFLDLSSSGGSREGAGRKPASPNLKKITKGIRLSSWVWDWLDKQEEPRGTMLEAALLEKHNLKPPTK